MSQRVYTEIPDTSDLEYWQVSQVGPKLKTFVPRDKALHQKLKREAWKKIQAALPTKHKSKIDFVE